MKICINGFEWDVITTDDEEKMTGEYDEICLGVTEYLELTIWIRDGMDKEITRRTIIHELVHAFVYSFAYTIEDEEAMCKFFEMQAQEIMKFTDQIMEKVVEGC